jgi:hypothetical protein
MGRAHTTDEIRRDREVSTLLDPTGSATARNITNELAEKRRGRGKERTGKNWRELERAESLSKE